MNEFIKIGDVSNLLNLSQATLRHYDKIDFIKPEYKKEHTNYRFYSREQFFKLIITKFLKSRGFSLTETLKYFQISSPEKIISLYYQKLLKIQKDIQKKENMLNKLQITQNKIQLSIDLKRSNMDLRPLIRSYPGQTFIVAPLLKFTRLDFFQTHNYLIERLSNFKIRILNFYQIFFPEEYSSENMFMAIPIQTPTTGKKEIIKNELLEIPPQLFFTCLHQGTLETSQKTLKNLYKELEEQGFTRKKSIPIIQEHYNPISFIKNNKNFIFELRLPIEKIS